MHKSVSLLVCFVIACVIQFSSANVSTTKPITPPLAAPATPDKPARTRSFNEPYAMPHGFVGHPYKTDLFQLLPVLLILAFIPLLVPIILHLLSGLFVGPMLGDKFGAFHGRKRRDVNQNGQTNPVMSDRLQSAFNMFINVLEKINETE